MTTRQGEVAEAAAPLFLAQGLAGTTMGDIARAAGLSRQGLYLIFPNKERVFAASVAVLNAGLHAQLEAGLARRTGLRDRLGFMFERWVAGVFDLQRATPEASDMDDLAFPVVREVYARFVERVSALIAEEAGPVMSADECTELARVAMFAVRGLFATATDGADMRRLTTLQVELVVGHVDSCKAH